MPDSCSVAHDSTQGPKLNVCDKTQGLWCVFMFRVDTEKKKKRIVMTVSASLKSALGLSEEEKKEGVGV